MAFQFHLWIDKAFDSFKKTYLQICQVIVKFLWTLDTLKILLESCTKYLIWLSLIWRKNRWIIFNNISWLNFHGKFDLFCIQKKKSHVQNVVKLLWVYSFGFFLVKITSLTKKAILQQDGAKLGSGYHIFKRIHAI